jgi:hypothetical protein
VPGGHSGDITSNARGADLACLTYAFGGGCLAFIDDLCHVTWPRKFCPGITFKYDGTTDPREFLLVYTMAMEIAEGGHPHVLANWFPLALKALARDWLLHLPWGSVRLWAHLCEQFVMRSRADTSAREPLTTFWRCLSA